MISAPAAHPRRSIYYWKCDRAAAFHGTSPRHTNSGLDEQLVAELRRHFGDETVRVQPAGGQGNHLTYVATIAGREAFVRVEDGPEQDDYLEVESRVLADVGVLGVPAPRVHAVDASRHRVPFAWQVMDLVAAPDLNAVSQRGGLDLEKVAEEIGAMVARWQALRPGGFGPFDPAVLREENRLVGFHSSYREYFHLHLERHLQFLVARNFLSREEVEQIAEAVAAHDALLELGEGCLVHKDLALWNILGTESRIAAVIDWDDAISGDVMDDLSLLGCFHGGAVLARALAGYRSVCALPPDFQRRFWLHLLRNMIVKAVIRVGAGYFERDEGFYLIGAGGSGKALREFTRARIALALRGLREDQSIEALP